MGTWGVCHLRQALGQLFMVKKIYTATPLTPIFDSFQNFSHIIAIESVIYAEIKNIEKSLEEKHGIYLQAPSNANKTLSAAKSETNELLEEKS